MTLCKRWTVVVTSSNYVAVILLQAEKGITDILDYIANELINPTAAKNLWLDIKEAIGRPVCSPYKKSRSAKTDRHTW